MVRRTENWLNIAHGQYVMLGAYFGYMFYMVLKLNLILSIVLAVVVVAVLGYVFNLVIFRPIRAYGGLYLLFSSVGLAYIIHGSIEGTFGSRPKAFLIEAPHSVLHRRLPGDLQP